MASTHLLVSSSPAPAHQLHRPFCYFEPQPSPLSRSNNGLFRNNSLSSFHQDLISDDYLENLDNNLEDLVESEDLNSEQYEREDVQSIIEDEDGLEDKESTESGHDDDDEYFEEEDLVNVIDTASQNPSPSKAGFSPTLDASFASSMSFGTAPPTPSIIKKPQNTRSNVATSTSSFLPAHLFEPNPNAMPPSSSPHRMDISPALGRRFLIPSQSNPSNLAIPHSPDDPFGCPSHPPSQVIWTNSPINSETRRTIGLRKANSRPLILSDSLISNTSRGPSNKSASTTDGMDIDSPSYAHHDNQKHSLSSDDQPSSELQFSQRSTRSASQSSTGKRSRSEEDEECQESSHSSSSGNLSHHSQTSPLHSSSPKQIALQVPRRSASNLFAPSQDGFSPSPYSLSPYNSSSPYPIISPSVKAAAKMTLGRKSGQRSLSGFSFPATKGLGPFNSNNSTSSRSHQYGMGSLGASSNACPTRRPALGVVQSSAALFSRYQQSNSNLNRPRDATGRPPSKSRRAISFAATQTDPKTSSLLLQSGLEVEEDDEDEELDVSLAFNCSPAPRTSTINFSEHPLVSNTWPKYTSSPNPNSPLVIDSPDQSKQPRKRSPPPPALGSLAPPLLSNSMKLLQSPTANLVTNIGFNIESPVGMGFSEKERAEGAFDEKISKRIVIDCRFGYEYEGGHIRDAINIREKEIVEAMLLKGTMFKGGQDDVPKPSESGKVDSTGQKKKMVIVFHCEYSAMRAPTV
ncbi:hypothetical protein O181_039596 [Austropuccinia psidii MF-1]|uniref:Rhodanese domain-containing protein n=1 Tax=Austropuccinia psidii MF-1 TaxID=1389203 RepID=A0A9Q3DG78_9BASI|nr:hypothetical protein [Austropuccinia psidii MF-1]